MRGSITIQIAGKPVGLRFGVPSVQMFAEQLTTDKKGIFYTESGMSDYGWSKMMQCAYENQCLLDEKDPVLKFGAFVDWFEEKMETEGGIKEIADVMRVYADSSVGKKITEASEEKKSLTLKDETPALTSTPSNLSATESLDGNPEITIGQPSEKSFSPSLA